MSPALLRKYLDAGKQIASHATLLPDGIRFSIKNSRRDWTDEKLAEIRARFTDGSLGPMTSESATRWATSMSTVTRGWESPGNCRSRRYLLATLEERTRLRTGARRRSPRWQSSRQLSPTLPAAALGRSLNLKQSSLVLDRVRARWRAAGPGDVKGWWPRWSSGSRPFGSLARSAWSVARVARGSGCRASIRC